MSRIRCLACMATALVPAVAGCESTGNSNVDSTAREVIVLDADGEYPCILQFEPTGVVIRPDPAGAHPDPGGQLAMQTDGTLYTSTPRGGQVLVWSKDGDFLRTIGSPGPGPGELGPGSYPRLDMNGTVHVIDLGQGRWNRYASDGTFLSVTTSPHLRNATGGSSALFGTDTLLVADHIPGSEAQFQLVGSDGQVLSAFGHIPTATPPLGYYARNISPAGAGGFWAGPLHGTPEYVLEEWSVDGQLKRRIRREVSWFAEMASRKPVVHSDGTREGLPLIIRPFVGSGGQLIVMTTYLPLDDSVGDIWYEVIDPDRQLVLASLRMPGNERLVRFDLEPGTEVGFISVRDELGLLSYEILRYSLKPGEVGSRALCGS